MQNRVVLLDTQKTQVRRDSNEPIVDRYRSKMRNQGTLGNSDENYFLVTFAKNSCEKLNFLST